jgi:hypothetical protein
LKNEHNSSRSRGLETGRWLIFLMLFSGLMQVGAQQRSLLTSVSESGSSLPDGPDAQRLAGGAVGPQDAARVSGSIHGVVMDKDGAVCEGATVALEFTGTNAPAARMATSDNNGRFSFSDVPPGAFKLAVSSKGFETQTAEGVLHSGESFEAQVIVLPVTSTSEVTVTASQVEIAAEQVKRGTTARAGGYSEFLCELRAPNAAPLTTRQKFDLAWKTSIDPVTFCGDGIFAGVEQAENTFSGYGQGVRDTQSASGPDMPTALSIRCWAAPFWLRGGNRIRGISTRERGRSARALVCDCQRGDLQGRQREVAAELLRHCGRLAAGGIANLLSGERPRWRDADFRECFGRHGVRERCRT